MCLVLLERRERLWRHCAKAYPQLTTRGHIIDKDWAWFAFLEGLKDSTVSHAAQLVAEGSNNQVILEISAGYPTSPDDFDPYSLLDYEELSDEGCRSPIDGGLVWFTVVGDELNKLEERCIRDIMAPIVTCRRLSDLPMAFQRSKQLPWAWIDIFIGTLVSVVPNDQMPSGCWGASDIWHKLLRPWLPWII